jgi:hypothetical protein
VNAEKSLDLEATEFFVRSRMHQAGAQALEKILESVGRGSLAAPPVCAEKHLPVRMRSLGLRSKQLLTILGGIAYRRSAYQCPRCGKIRYPGDELLGVVGTGFSPGARRMMARAGAQDSFGQSANDLQLYAGMRVDPKDVEREAEGVGRLVENWMACEASLPPSPVPAEQPPQTLYIEFDGTGAPMRAEELTQSRGKAADGKARTREVKLGCVFTQTTLDEEGNPARDPAATTYVGAIEQSCDFGCRIHGEARRRGLDRAQRVVVLTDGAKYNKTIIDEHFSQAIRVLDFTHAKGHLIDFVCEVCRQPLSDPLYKQAYKLLYDGKIPALLERMQAALPRSGERRAHGERAINYFRENASAMGYDKFRAMGLFIGSGLIEAGCATIVGQRLKRSGMFWSLKGANAIIALRCCLASGRFEQFWESTA